MERPALDRGNVRSPYADQLNEGFRRLRFNPLLEKEFREFYLEQTLPRGRLSLLLALLPIVVIAAVQWVSASESRPTEDTLWRLGVLFPLLIATAGVMWTRIGRRWYAEIAATSIALAGVIVSCLSHEVALQGEANLLGAQTLSILYGCLFLGLMFDVAVAVGAALLAWHFASGVIMGVAGDELWYAGGIIATAGAAALVTTYKLEHVVRTSFLETRLLHTLAERDGMTGLYNRRIFDDYVERVWRQSRREGETFALIFVDIDDFKIYNDLYGHQAGDDALKRVAHAIARCAKRPFDFTARYGGEEFVMILYGPPAEYGRALPERIRSDVEQLAMIHEGSKTADVVTVSVGAVIVEPNSARSLAGAIQSADEALYQAKREGRNRVVVRGGDEHCTETGNFRVEGSLRIV